MLVVIAERVYLWGIPRGDHGGALSPSWSITALYLSKLMKETIMNMKKTYWLGAIFATALMVGCAGNDSFDRDAYAENQEGVDAERQNALHGVSTVHNEHPQYIDLDTVVYFAFDRADLNSEARATLDQWSNFMKHHLDKRTDILVEGHADQRGTRAYNMGLGERRAMAVKQYLITQGVPARDIRTVSYGAERPANPAQNPTAWAENRRAVLIIGDESGPGPKPRPKPQPRY
jgi:peptidoglycan-associated lipoprotein